MLYVQSASVCRFSCLFAVLLSRAVAQQFEIPAEMLAQMMGGGGMMGGGQQRKLTEWPKNVNSAIEPAFEWLVNTEWKGKTAKYTLVRDGIVESPLKECETEGMCIWAANNGRVIINTPTLKVINFKVDGLDKADRKKLENKDEKELKKLKLVTEKANKAGKRSELEFSQLAQAANEDTIPTGDLYALLGLEADVDQSKIKSAFRKLSITNHPDKGGDPALFNQMRDAYEILSIVDDRRYYDIGGAQLVKNARNLQMEADQGKAQMEAQLAQIPKGHPQRAMAEAQMQQQMAQFEPRAWAKVVKEKLTNQDMEVIVPVSAKELYNGVAKKAYEFKRLVICRGCRADQEAEHCRECGRCPPEKIQVPKYAQTPFGKQVVGAAEKEQESRERCREVVMNVEFKISKGAKEGSTIKRLPDAAHQVPGKIPGAVVFKVQRGDPNDTYTMAENDLHTVVPITLEQALFGFSLSFQHLEDETVTISRTVPTTRDNEVLRMPNRGLASSGTTGSLFVRLVVDMPKLAEDVKKITLEAPATAGTTTAVLLKEDEVELKDGEAWKRWRMRESAKGKDKTTNILWKAKKAGGKQEL